MTDVDQATTRAERIQIANRPRPFDGFPVVGFWGGLPGLYIATVPTGVTLGALTGRLAAEEITTGEAPKLLEGFSPSRVIGAATTEAARLGSHTIGGEPALSR